MGLKIHKGCADMKSRFFAVILVIVLGLAGCTPEITQDTATQTTTATTTQATTQMTTVTTTQTTTQTTEKTTVKNTTPQINKMLTADINNDGTDDAIYINNYCATFAYYSGGEIKEIRAEANWGGELEGGGAPLYYNKKTDEFLAESTASSYKNYSFYEFSDGEYKLKNEYIWREIKTLIDDMGSFNRVNQYTIDDKEVTESKWRKTIDDFIGDEDTVLLCPDNTDLEFVDIEDFDVYWLCGDILYHGAEETEYKGKIAHEKYLEYTRNQAFRELITDNQKNIDKLMIDDINNDGMVELVFVNYHSKQFSYYSDGEIITLDSLANVGGNCACGSAPLYYNENTDEIMIRRSYSDYRDICFYEYKDGDYSLTKQYKWGGFTFPLGIDEWYESPDLDALLKEENLTFEELKKLDEAKLDDYAYSLGYTWKMDQYMFEDEIITEAEWDNAINEFKSADGCISLCPDNPDLEFIEMQSEGFSDYVEGKLFN
jgi:uncharacterized protein YceK